MTTQSLRGMANHGPMHWRGDRTGGNDAISHQPNSGTFNEDAAFKKFNPAFQGLIGRSAQLTGPEMQAFTDFILQVTYPPNPDPQPRQLAHAEPAARASTRFFGPTSDTLGNCDCCHKTDRIGNQRCDQPGAGFLRYRRAIELRRRDPALQDPAPAERVPKGRHVRPAEQSRHQSREQRIPRRSGPRLRVPA